MCFIKCLDQFICNTMYAYSALKFDNSCALIRGLAKGRTFFYAKRSNWVKAIIYILTQDYRPMTTDIVTPFAEQWPELFPQTSDSLGVLVNENVGFCGAGITADSLPNMNTTESMVGRSAALSWTHSNPTCMHLWTSFSTCEFCKGLSSNSSILSSFHSSQACMLEKICMLWFMEVWIQTRLNRTSLSSNLTRIENNLVWIWFVCRAKIKSGSSSTKIKNYSAQFSSNLTRIHSLN